MGGRKAQDTPTFRGQGEKEDSSEEAEEVWPMK